MKKIALRGQIAIDDDAYFFTSELGGDYIISINSSTKERLSNIELGPVQINGIINGSKLHILSIKELD